MARQGPEFCKMDTDFILNDVRWATLPGDAAKIYLFCWAQAVRSRRAAPRELSDVHFISNRVHLPVTICTEMLTILSRAPFHLIKFRQHASGSIGVTVLGVKSKHAALIWKDVTQTGQQPDPNGSESQRLELESKIEPPLPPVDDAAPSIDPHEPPENPDAGHEHTLAMKLIHLKGFRRGDGSANQVAAWKRSVANLGSWCRAKGKDICDIEAQVENNGWFDATWPPWEFVTEAKAFFDPTTRAGPGGRPQPKAITDARDYYGEPVT